MRNGEELLKTEGGGGGGGVGTTLNLFKAGFFGKTMSLCLLFFLDCRLAYFHLNSVRLIFTLVRMYKMWQT